MIIPLAHIVVRDRDWNVYISIDDQTRNLHVFKYSEDQCLCEYEICTEQGAAEEFIRRPFKSIQGLQPKIHRR